MRTLYIAPFIVVIFVVDEVTHILSIEKCMEENCHSNKTAGENEIARLELK